jgi:arylformamidase
MRVGSRIVDVSLRLPEEALTFLGDSPFRIDGPYSYVPGEARELCYALSMSTQAGTHIQGGHYFKEGGKSIDQYDLSRFEGPCYLINCAGKRIIDREFLAAALPAEDLSGLIPILYTGFVDKLLAHKGSREFRLSEEDLREKPGLTLGAAELLVERKVGLLGIDSVGFELYPTQSHAVNRLLCDHDVLLLENLCRLDRLPPEGGWLECFPLPIVGVEGTPCRAVVRPGMPEGPLVRP